ncbi:hypothetical protein [Mycolicibacterium arenosum]|uniref:Uncharacterized protein n=1 Tax=Mycolicibacterium arenosum TaxID=2952157 RepID=A0ABT1M595_9MYCO|nr:hypothetical protein [Mycolicibacterium sp. CAU 1645]MCP9274040.1 hypothetical protein [Mycolicibacterium sp. CAU 1645]
MHNDLNTIRVINDVSDGRCRDHGGSEPRVSDPCATIADVASCGARDIGFHSEIAAIIHARLNDAECGAASRERIAAIARKVADHVKRDDPTFCYEWFYGACGLDPWGDLQPHFDPSRAPIVKWDPDIKDFRRIERDVD